MNKQEAITLIETLMDPHEYPDMGIYIRKRLKELRKFIQDRVVTTEDWKNKT